MSDEELLEELEPKRAKANAEAEKHRKARDHLNNETKEWAKKRDELNGQVRKIIEEANQHRQKRDELTKRYGNTRLSGTNGTRKRASSSKR